MIQGSRGKQIAHIVAISEKLCKPQMEQSQNSLVKTGTGSEFKVKRKRLEWITSG